MYPFLMFAFFSFHLFSSTSFREDRKTRLKMRQAEDTAHRTLIINTAEESWKRHAYRLAHPAYADGRIW